VKFQDTRILLSEKKNISKKLKSLKILYQDINKIMAKILKVPECSYGYLPAGRQVVKEEDEILIYEHYTGELIFEYNKNKEVDKEAFREFEEV